VEGLLTVVVVAVGLVSPLLPALLDGDDEGTEAGFAAVAACCCCSSSVLLFSLKSMRFLVFCPEAEVLASSGSVLTCCLE